MSNAFLATSCINSKMADITLLSTNNMERADKRKRKGSKRSKKNWRKKTDVEDVEEHLEDIRREERTGGVVSEKSNEELFFIEKESRDQNIKESKESKVKDVTEDPESAEEEEFLSRKEKMKIKEQQEKEKETQKLLKIQKTSRDIWSCKGNNNKFKIDSWVESTLPTKPKKPKSLGGKPFPTNAIEVCHPGSSYNPDYEDHQDLLNHALREEVTSLKKQESLNQKIKFLSEEEIKKQPGWLQEMSEGLVANRDEISESKSEPDCDGEFVLSKVINAEDRKAKRIRAKERLQKHEGRVKKENKTNRMKLNDIYRLRSLKREITVEEAELEEKRQRRIELQMQKDSKPKRLGKLKYESPKVDFQLSEELPGSLRGLKGEGDPFTDRMKSFQKRCLIEPRKRVLPHRKYKEKYVDKRSYKKPTVKDFTSKLS